jgi:hypothetical protein
MSTSLLTMVFAGLIAVSVAAVQADSGPQLAQTDGMDRRDDRRDDRQDNRDERQDDRQENRDERQDRRHGNDDEPGNDDAAGGSQ